MIKLPDLTDPTVFLMYTLLLFIIISGRYILTAGIFYAIFYIWYPHKWAERKLSRRAYQPRQFTREIGWSLATSVLFSLMGVCTLLMWQMGYTRVYTDISRYGWIYLPVSLLLAMALQETYYYWVHRWMHRPAVFRIVHKVHHESNITSPFTAFSFHPVEGLLQAIVLPLTLLFIPMHPAVILVLLLIMSFSSVINHLNIEIFPLSFQHSKIGRWVIGATHHSLHHSQFKYNYGLYFTIWDRLKKTESPSYSKLMQESEEKLNREV